MVPAGSGFVLLDCCARLHPVRDLAVEVAMITVAQLDAAPVGSRVIFDWDDAAGAIYRKVDDGWLLIPTPYRHKPIPADILFDVWEGHWTRSGGRARILPPQPPAPVRVWSWTGVLGTPHHSWACLECPAEAMAFELFYADSGQCHDDARAHARTHVKWAACVPCGERFPISDLASHYAADHGVIGVRS